MKKPEYTAEQKAIIEHEGGDLLVSASAGAGKTLVLIERVYHLLTKKKLQLKQLLIVTFTKKAAQEMKQRLKKRLEESLRDPEIDSKMKQHLQKQILALPTATISTIDSFCLQMLRDYGYLLGLDSKLTLASNLELVEMHDTCFETWLAKNEAEPKYEVLLHYFKEVDELKEALETANRELDAVADEEHLYQTWPSYYAQPDDFEQKEKNAAVQNKISEITSFLEQNSEFEQEKIYNEYVKFKEELVRYLADNHYQPQITKLAKGKKLQGDNPCTQKKVNDLLQQLGQNLCVEDKKNVALVSAFIDAVQEVRGLEKAWRQEKNKYLYSDIEKLSFQLLQRLEVKQHYQNQLCEVMVDEYQDVNDLQEQILLILSGGSDCRYFMVGDVKQSIYQFRKSTPELFLQKRKQFLTNPSTGTVITLRTNFRSRPEILDFSNQVFQTKMTEDFGGLEYTAEEALTCGRQDWTGHFPIETLILTNNGELPASFLKEASDFSFLKREEIETGKIDNIRALAHLVAQKIQQLHKEQGLAYGDIAILAKNNGQLEILDEILTSYHLPVNKDERGNYFEASEIQQVLAFLSIIDNPYQDVPFVAVLRSAFVGLKENDLAILFTQEQTERTSVYQKVQAQAEYDERLQHFLSAFEQLRAQKASCSVGELIQKLLQFNDFIAYQAGSVQGDERLQRLNGLYEKAKEFEEAEYRGLTRFLACLEQEKASVDKNKVKNEPTEQQNAVHLLTIHKSKGLEYPTVFLFQINKALLNNNSKSKLLLFSNKNHLAFKAKQAYNLQDEPAVEMLPYENWVETPIFKAVQAEKEKEELEEALRVLYVALTRPKEKLYLVLNESRKEKNSYYNWLLEAEADQLWKEEQVCLSDLIVQSRKGQSQQQASLLISSDVQKEKAEERALATALTYLNQDYTYQKQLSLQSYQSVSHIQNLFRGTEAQALTLTQEEVKKRDLWTEGSTEWRQPQFLATSPQFTAAQQGTALHLLLQRLDFTQSNVAAQLDDLVQCLIKEGKLERYLAQNLSYQPILQFLASDFGRFVQQEATHLYKEVPFSALVPIEGEQVLIHGIIDAYILLEDEIILYDYKTNRRRKGESQTQFKARMLQQYTGQLRLYAQALQASYPQHKIRAFLVLLAENTVVSIPLNEA